MTTFTHDKVVPNQSSTLDKKEQVADMFNDISGRYDFLNRFLSAGIDISWRKKALEELREIAPKHLLDVATGTADVAIMAAKQLQPDKITGIDISEGMLEVGRQKIKDEKLEDTISLLKGDSEAINFKDETFDAVTVAFGVRNFMHLEKGLSEILRVLKPGGKLVVLEFSKPATPVVKSIYSFYMKIVTPGVGKLFSKNRDAYKYLDESIRQFPEGKHFSSILDQLGFHQTYSKTLSLGICSIYCGTK
ncbi:MAG: bifunctional demethylmenaquinone methyltransferase/2-methoxy-6-polyprenyl-1,4-benzoquinol methylase UbiE [Sphingobacteriales bacterium]|nr:bifunctional demethylmenaquinone methyltransferase/2-methoxy-6-polyprenyl-1,4-benzoquinol methylase UbiE [Sphingobacteriales bacterium]